MPPLVILCRCVVCCCPPGEGHNDPKWIAYEKMIDEIEAEWSGAGKSCGRAGLHNNCATMGGWRNHDDALADRRLDRDPAG